MNRYWFFILSLFLLSNSFAQSISFTSVEFNEATGVKLQWNFASIPPAINKVELFRYSPISSGYESIYTDNVTATTKKNYTDGAATDETISYKYIVAISSSNGSTYTDTVSSIALTVTQSTSYNRAFRLHWNLPYNTFSEVFFVYRKIQGGSDVLIGTSDSNVFHDTIFTLCEADITYYVYHSKNGTTYRSNSRKISFADLFASPPQWNNVSIDPVSSKITLSWIPGEDKDIMGYIICKGEPCITFDTIYGKEQSGYQCNSCDPLEVYDFKIYAFDSCSNPNFSTLTESQNNIVLKYVSEACTRKMSLAWNQYKNMRNGLGGYTVFIQENGSSFRVLGTTNANTTSFEYTVPELVTSVNFYVQAFNQPKTIISNSNTVSELFQSNVQKYVYIESASVLDDNLSVEIEAVIDSSFSRKEFDLFRGTNGSTPVFYRKVNPNGIENFLISDASAEPSKNTYTYYLISTEGCASNTSTTIKTSIAQPDKNTALLSWTPYEGWNVQHYEIERKLSNLNWVSIGTNATTLNFTDDVSIYKDSPERIFYRVIAHSPSGEKAASSVSEFIKEGYLKLPNAFIPNANQSSLNSRFKPLCFSMLEEGYSFRVYNRHGECVFHTNRPDEGWDGKFRGKLCPVGGYVYLIECIFRNGKTETLSGTFLLVE